MANSLDSSIRSAAEKLVKALEENTTLTVRTFTTEVGANSVASGGQDRNLIAETTIKLDGDYSTVIPVQRTEAGMLESDQDLLMIHQQNIAAAIEYRNKVLNALLSIIR